MKKNKDSNQIKRFYNLIAEETAKNWYPNTILLPTIKDFLSLLPEHPRILDLGCGPGHESMRLSSLGARVVGIDFSEDSLKIARQRNPACQFHLMDFFAIGDSLEFFDGIFACGSLIHVAPNQMPVLISILKKRLRKSGYLEVIIQDGKGQRILDHQIRGEKIKRIIYLYPKIQITNFFESGGFAFFKEGFLDAHLLGGGWRNYIFRIKD
jgi:SAM-dependent methyltransferase